MTNNDGNEPRSSSAVEREATQRTRRAFLTMGATAAAAFGAWSWLRGGPETDKLASPFRRMLQFNERVAGIYYDKNHLAPVFPAKDIEGLRLNGDIGLGGDFDPATWNLTVKSATESAADKRVTLAQIRSLPRVEYITQLKCIEGWSVVMHWAGSRFSDFTERFAPDALRAQYVSMQTPDEEYFVGLDMASALHPQTLLCYEMNGSALTMKHGAPLRLAIPVKYGVKNIKRIGTIAYSSERPRDYWAEEGYDWYAGL